MSKSQVWNQLKALGYGTEQLKTDYGVTYQSASLEQLQSILEVTEKHFKTDVPEWRDAANDDVVLGGNQLQPKNTDAVLSKPFNYDQELAKLKDLSKEEFTKLIREVQTVKGFSSYYIVKWEVMQQYLTVSEWEAATKVTMDLEDEFQFNSWLKLMSVDECFNEAGNFLFS